VPTTRVIQVDPDRPDHLAIAEAARILRGGGLVAFATETVYGLGADATNPDAVARIFEAKGRPSTNPLIVHVESKQAARACVADWPDRAEILADRFWPGPLTLVLPRSAIIPDIVTAGGETVGVRLPLPAVARWLILEAGRPIAAPSANRSTGISPTKAEHVLKDLDGRVDLILDSGPTTVGIESTVLDLSTNDPRILRPGEVTPDQIAEALGIPVGGPIEPAGSETRARSPGLMEVHYSPRTPAYRIDRNRLPSAPIEGRFADLTIGEHCDGTSGPFFTHRGIKHDRLADPEGASSHLYAWLHEIDDLDLDFILIVPPPDEPQWRAIRDRIWRATKPWPPGSARLRES
jgi:L-threonylcarbamoyladenylate synthase